MRDAFGTVLWIVCALGLIGAVVALVLSGSAWREYGKDALLMDHEGPQDSKPGSAAALLERDTEIRQMLEARNARRARRGEPALDVEAELAKLTAPRIDSALRAEIRDLVVARNHRRVRAGKEPLDVEIEIERQIERLGEV